MNQSSIKQNPVKQPAPKTRTPRTDRPTADQSRLLYEQVVEAALRLFQEHGYDGVSMESALTKATDVLLQQALHPTYVKLGRIAAAKASRFPTEEPYNFDMSLSPRVRAVTDILRAFRHELDDTSTTNLEMIAELFVSLISGIPASFGTLREPDHEQQRLHLAVRLFTKAIRAPQ